MSERMKGTVKWFNADRGFGFIQPEQGKEIFVHIYGVKHNACLTPGQQVEFNITQGKKGPQADNVIVISNQISGDS